VTYHQTKDEMESHLREQIGFLKKSSQSYDGGYKSEAKRLAVVIRVLLHDTNTSTSLLAHLGKKDDILFYDTALDYDPNHLPSTMGLVIRKANVRKGDRSSAEYEAPLDNGPPPRYSKGKIPFEKWWNKIVFADKSGNKLTRKTLVLSISNKDGGAHVDYKLDREYASITRHGSLGSFFLQKDNKRYPATHPELASIRQISHEILKSLKDEFPEHFITH